MVVRLKILMKRIGGKVLPSYLVSLITLLVQWRHCNSEVIVLMYRSLVLMSHCRAVLCLISCFI